MKRLSDIITDHDETLIAIGRADQVVGDKYEELFEYFLNVGDMPYGTAKARTGDPYIWIEEQLNKLYA